MTERLSSMLLLCALCAVTLTLAGCGPDYSTPEGTVKALHKAMEAEDKEAMKRCLVKAEREEKKEGEDGKVEITGNTSKKEDRGSWSVGTATIDGDKAKVPVTYEKDGKKETANYVCIKEEGEWRVSKIATLFGAMAEGMKEAAKD